MKTKGYCKECGNEITEKDNLFEFTGINDYECSRCGHPHAEHELIAPQVEIVSISENELRQLLMDSITLNILEGDGVDNWEWYMEGRKAYIAEAFGITEHEVWEKDYDVEDVVEKILKTRYGIE